MTIRQARLDDLEPLTKLFDGYRVFYQQPSDLEGASDFLYQRFTKQDSIILVALDQYEKPIGFTQLYPSFSSVSMQPLWILNDLYVTTDNRGNGAGKALIEAAQELATKQGWKGLVLETAADNPARQLYERTGWRQDGMLHYSWSP
jgi:GNAT superfamily N-acetyltransferase